MTIFIEIFIEGIATAEAQGETTITLSRKDTIYLFEFYRIFKVGGIASPFATIEWPGVQIPQAITAILQDKGINITLINNDGAYQETPIYFYERNPSGRGLDFDEIPDQKADFLRYAIRLNCINPIRDIIKKPTTVGGRDCQRGLDPAKGGRQARHTKQKGLRRRSEDSEYGRGLVSG